nr:head-tail connector protein [uncultured Cellulosilyticum sp.]
MLEKVKNRLGIKNTNKDTLLQDYIDDAILYFESRTSKEYNESQHGYIIKAMVIEDYRKRGNEGVSITSVSGLSTHFIDGYSENIEDKLDLIKYGGSKKGWVKFH